jgi:hypothetical protein
MSMKEFIKQNRIELDKYIAKELKMDKNPRPNDAERRLWVLNSEDLYRWAQSAGVRI